MKNYSVFTLDGQKEKLLLIAENYQNPINDFICDDYVDFLDNGDVLFDLGIINGVNSNRFVRASIVNHRFLADTIDIVDDVSPEVLKQSRQFFLDNPELLERSVQPPSVQRKLRT